MSATLKSTPASRDGVTARAGTGHFHLLIDAEDVPEGVAIPFDDVHLHYGKGQMAADVPLPPGKHALTLQFANAEHVSYGSGLRAALSVDVKAD